MIKRRIYLPVLLAFLFFYSCETSKSPLPGYSGASGELVIVADNKLWESSLRILVDSTVGDYQFGLPQPEKKFNIIHIPPASFIRVFQIHRNILIVNLNPNASAKLEVKKNVWSNGQVVAELTIPDQTALDRFLKQNSNLLIETYNKEEVARLIDKNTKLAKQEPIEQIKQKHHFDILLQKDAYLAKEVAEFVWFRLERERNKGGFMHQISQGVLVYYYPYTDTLQLEPERLLAMRDSLTKMHIPGPSDSTYMSVSRQLVLPEAEVITYKSNYAVEIRGLWRVENAFMGGPFYSLTWVDTKRNRIITAEGYVFAPQFQKREYLREVEAMVKSVSVF